jgi:hypothetical protein
MDPGDPNQELDTGVIIYGSSVAGSLQVKTDQSRLELLFTGTQT